MNAALDIDGTITAHPRFFSVVSRSIRASGGKVIVVTSRADAPGVRETTRRELRSYGVEFDDLVIIPDGTDRIPCPHLDLGRYDQYLWQKVAVCLDRGVTIAFEDDPKVIILFKRFAPGIRMYQVA